MTLATTLLAAAFVMPSMPPPEYDDCEVVTNCVFDTSRGDAKMFALKIELDAAPSNGVVFSAFRVEARSCLWYNHAV